MILVFPLLYRERKCIALDLVDSHFGNLPFLFTNGQKVPIGILMLGSSSKWTCCPLTNFVITITSPTNVDFRYMNTASDFSQKNFFKNRNIFDVLIPITI